MPKPTVGVDISKLANGTTISLDTVDDQLFEVKMVNNTLSVVEVSGTDPRLKRPTSGVLTHSTVGKEKHQHFIAKDSKVTFVFKNGTLETQSVKQLTVRGHRDGNMWHYDVF